MIQITLLVLLALAVLAYCWYPLRRWYFKTTTIRRLRKEIQTSDELIASIGKHHSELFQTYTELNERLLNTPLEKLSGADRAAVRSQMSRTWLLRIEARDQLLRANLQRDEFVGLLKEVEEM